MYSNRSHVLKFCRLPRVVDHAHAAEAKDSGFGADARRKEARAATSEKARLAADQEEATVIWNAHYDEMEALKIANKNLTEGLGYLLKTLPDVKPKIRNSVENATKFVGFEKALQGVQKARQGV